MNEAQFKPHVHAFFASAGMSTFDIPRTSEETPDFEVTNDHEKYVVELKIKSDDEDEIKRDAEILGAGEILAKSKGLIRRNRLSGIVRKGCDQIDSYDPEKKHFHILWLHGSGPMDSFITSSSWPLFSAPRG